jgi:hypothetical protein
MDMSAARMSRESAIMSGSNQYCHHTSRFIPIGEAARMILGRQCGKHNLYFSFEKKTQNILARRSGKDSYFFERELGELGGKDEQFGQKPEVSLY